MGEEVFTCHLRVRNRSFNKTASLAVYYPPKLKLQNGSNEKVLITHQDPFELSCEIRGNPKPTIEWYFQADKGSITKIGDGEFISYDKMTSSLEGFYSCVGRNNIGNASKTFQVIDVPMGKLTRS